MQEILFSLASLFAGIFQAAYASFLAQLKGSVLDASPLTATLIGIFAGALPAFVLLGSAYSTYQWAKRQSPDLMPSRPLAFGVHMARWAVGVTETIVSVNAIHSAGGRSGPITVLAASRVVVLVTWELGWLLYRHLERVRYRSENAKWTTTDTVAAFMKVAAAVGTVVGVRMAVGGDLDGLGFEPVALGILDGLLQAGLSLLATALTKRLKAPPVQVAALYARTNVLLAGGTVLLLSLRAGTAPQVAPSFWAPLGIIALAYPLSLICAQIGEGKGHPALAAILALSRLPASQVLDYWLKGVPLPAGEKLFGDVLIFAMAAGMAAANWVSGTETRKKQRLRASESQNYFHW